eukprot:6479474-Amphidinium_carterae.2
MPDGIAVGSARHCKSLKVSSVAEPLLHQTFLASNLCIQFQQQLLCQLGFRNSIGIYVESKAPFQDVGATKAPF